MIKLLRRVVRALDVAGETYAHAFTLGLSE
jgi:hypothetical protein